MHTIKTWMFRLSRWFYKVSHGWIVFVGFLIFILFTIVILPSQAARAESYSQGAGTPDISFYYSSEQLFLTAQRYGESGRQEYVRARFTFDLVFPLVYGGFLVTANSWIFFRIISKNNRSGLINLVPFFGVVFDYLENISTSVVMLRFPDPTFVAGSLAGIFTGLKWTLIVASILMLVVGTIYLLANFVREFRARSANHR